MCEVSNEIGRRTLATPSPLALSSRRSELFTLMHKFNNVVERYEKEFITWLMIIMSALIFLQVIMRYVFNNSLSWSEELTVFISTYMIWVAGSFAIKKDAHLRITLFIDMLGEKSRVIAYILIDVIWLLFSFYMIYLGEKMVRMSFINKRISPAMQVPMWIIYAALLIGSFLMCLSLITKICERIAEIK